MPLPRACDIDNSGRFKYILIEATDKASGETSTLVRGYARCPYHGMKHSSFHTRFFLPADILDEVQEKLGKGIKLNCTGGGRIEKDNNAATIKIYGYSQVHNVEIYNGKCLLMQGFGQADHSIAQRIVKAAFPNYEVTTSNDGY